MSPALTSELFTANATSLIAKVVSFPKPAVSVQSSNLVDLCVCICWSCCNEVPQTRDFTTDMYVLMVLEAGGLRSRCWQGWFHLRSERENLFCVAPLVSGDVLAMVGVPWLATASLWSSHGILPMFLSLSLSLCPNFPF